MTASIAESSCSAVTETLKGGECLEPNEREKKPEIGAEVPLTISLTVHVDPDQRLEKTARLGRSPALSKNVTCQVCEFEVWFVETETVPIALRADRADWS